MSMKISSDTIGNRTRDPPACSVLPQLTNILSKLQTLTKVSKALVYFVMREDFEFRIDILNLE